MYFNWILIKLILNQVSWRARGTPREEEVRFSPAERRVKWVATTRRDLHISPRSKKASGVCVRRSRRPLYLGVCVVLVPGTGFPGSCFVCSFICFTTNLVSELKFRKMSSTLIAGSWSVGSPRLLLIGPTYLTGPVPQRSGGLGSTRIACAEAC